MHGKCLEMVECTHIDVHRQASPHISWSRESNRMAPHIWTAVSMVSHTTPDGHKLTASNTLREGTSKNSKNTWSWHRGHKVLSKSSHKPNGCSELHKAHHMDHKASSGFRGRPAGICGCRSSNCGRRPACKCRDSLPPPRRPFFVDTCNTGSCKHGHMSGYGRRPLGIGIGHRQR